MEKHRCKLCYRKFSNGRALGGHMRSHMMNLPLPPKHHPPPPPQLGCATESSTESPSFSQFSSSSSSDSEHEDTQMKNSPNHHHGGKDKDEDEDNIYTESITEPTGSSSLVTLQDRESETESFKKNPTRRRSKRSSSSSTKSHQHYCNYTPTKSVPEPVPIPESVSVSPVSSVSDVTSDTDLAYCLMMMSRDKWTNTISSGSKFKSNSVKKKYKCDTCNKVFRSYQALGGHRASHKKIRSNGSSSKNLLSSGVGQYGPVWTSGRNSRNFSLEVQEEEHERGKKVHECPVCFRVFSSGQALGGHKRSHGLLISGNNDDYVNGGNNHDYLALNDDDEHDGSPKKMKMKMKMMMVINGSDDNDITNENLIDLNLPPSDYYGDDNEEEISQIDDVHL